MKVYKYSNHNISRCSKIYPLLDINVETNYINSTSGFSRLSKLIKDLSIEPEIISEDEKFSPSDLTEYFEKTFELKSEWNILAITDLNDTPLSIIYDTYVLNTNEVDNIHLKYTLNYQDLPIYVEFNIGSEYVKHIAEFIGTNMQPIPKMLSRNYDSSIVNWSDSEFNMTYDNLILKDNKSSYDYLLKINLNKGISYTQDHEYYLSATTQDMFIFDIDVSNHSAKLFTLNDYGTNIPLASIDLPQVSISHIELVENGYGIILVDTSGYIYCCKADERRPEFSFDDSNWIELDNLDLTKYSYLVPTFVDLCGSYIKLPNPKYKTPTMYQVKKWTELFDESSLYGDVLYADIYNNPIDTAPGDCKLKPSYWESLSLLSNKTYFRSSGTPQNSPVSLHQFDTMSPTEGNCSILDMNLRAAVCLYADLTNNGRLDNRIVLHDCGLEIINQSGGNDFITYTGDHYKLPEGAKIMNMSYYKNTNNSSTVVSLVSNKTQTLDSPILCAKYGVILTKSMIDTYLPVGGRIFYIDETSDRSIEFYDENRDPISNISIGDTPTYYKVLDEGISNKDKYYIYNPNYEVGKYWGYYNISTGVTSSSLGLGKINTSIILSIYDSSDYAIGSIWEWLRIQNNNNLGGRSDWYIPDMDEVDKLKEYLYYHHDGVEIIDFIQGRGTDNNDSLWASTELDYNAAKKRASNGWIYDGVVKYSLGRCCAIRSI